MKAIPALCLALFLVAIHAAVLPKKSLQLKMHTTSKKAVKTRPGTYRDFNNRHVLAKGNATLAYYLDGAYAANVTLGTPGYLGLAWPSVSPNNYTPPIQNLLSQFDKPVFSIWLDRKGNNSDQAGGLLTLGAVDTQNCDSNVQYVPLTSLSFWQFSLSSFSVGSYSKTKTVPVFVDSSSNFLGVPPDAMNAIANATNAAYIAESNIYALPCNATGLPDLKFTINNQIYSVSQSEYISNINFGNGTCILAVYSVNNGGFGPSWTLGQPFMRSYCNVFDVGNKMIGFAKPKNSGF
uniref:Peptidase A1 domain-containing protein n=1 Tax=Acrobeloides nanus TaxID=290746 RepID=A0A914DY46_9BILA